MKKFAVIPIAALLLLGSCSKDEPARSIPTDPVVSVAPAADDVTLNAPTQTGAKNTGSTYYFNASYSNGMNILYNLVVQSKDGQEIYYALVKSIDYTGTDVVLPRTVTLPYNGKDVEATVYSLFLYTDGLPDNVTSITIPNTCIASYKQGKFEGVEAADLRAQVEHGANLLKVELENGYPGFCSIDGCIYSDDFTTLVSVPRGRSGVYTVTDGTETIDSRAFYYCQKLTGVTLPASVTSIESEAFDFMDDLLLINSLNPEAPSAPLDAFGRFARNAVVRIPAGSLGEYTPVKPEIEAPVVPQEPPLDCSEEEYKAYQDAMAQYRLDLAAYEEAMDSYTRILGWGEMKNIQEVNF